MAIALIRTVPDSIARCELTHVEREPIDLDRAREQHDAYERALALLGLTILSLPEAHDLPDSVFVEDTAVVLDEVAILTRPGAESRRAELRSVEPALSGFRSLLRIEAPAILDGGDVLVLDREILVGLTTRTNDEGIAQLRKCVEGFGYGVRPASVHGCLHLKSAVTRVGPRDLLINPEWVDPNHFPDWRLTESDPGEPFGANALWWDGAPDVVVHAAEHPRTRARLETAGIRVCAVPAGELAKAEGGVTCGALVIR
jgi:dimethylargininase